MKNSEIFLGMLLDAGFESGVNFLKHDGGIYLDADAVNFLSEKLHPEVSEHLSETLKGIPLSIQTVSAIEQCST